MRMWRVLRQPEQAVRQRNALCILVSQGYAHVLILTISTVAREPISDSIVEIWHLAPPPRIGSLPPLSDDDDEDLLWKPTFKSKKRSPSPSFDAVSDEEKLDGLLGKGKKQARTEQSGSGAESSKGEHSTNKSSNG